MSPKSHGGLLATLQVGPLFCYFANDMKTALILELPDKGAFAPGKIGTSHGNYLKTNIPGQQYPAWAWEGKLYSTDCEKDVAAFNEVCAKIIPHSHQRKMRCIVRIISLPENELSQEPEVTEPEVTEFVKTKAVKAPKPRKAPKAPKAIPPLIIPPSLSMPPVAT